MKAHFASFQATKLVFAMTFCADTKTLSSRGTTIAAVPVPVGCNRTDANAVCSCAASTLLDPARNNFGGLPTWAIGIPTHVHQATCTTRQTLWVTSMLRDPMGKHKHRPSAPSIPAALIEGQFEVLQCHGEHSIISQVNAIEKRLFSRPFALTGEDIELLLHPMRPL